ncbi:DoxX family protein [Plantactinospora sp. ZYX-F-223]|uniref:DoxX family protein n=1 Tax=Plantactinospora sp. ZYX-F-223 TaxID=3144103 RepID=UPI0031FC44B5
MSTMTSNTRTRTRTTPRRLLWIPQILLGLGIAGGGIAKLSGDPSMVTMFDDIGAGQWFRYVVGALELAGGIGLFVPRFAALAALCLAGLLVGAAFTSAVVLGASPLMAIGYLVVAALIAWFRRRDLAVLKATGQARG